MILFLLIAVIYFSFITPEPGSTAAYAFAFSVVALLAAAIAALWLFYKQYMNPGVFMQLLVAALALFVLPVLTIFSFLVARYGL